MTTNEHQPEKTSPVSTGRSYGSVKDLLDGEHVAPDVKAEVESLAAATVVVRALVAMRAQQGLTQEELGKRLGLSQGAISKIEHGRDEDLSMGTLQAYAKALDTRFAVGFGRPPEAVESIKAHAEAMRREMLKLARLANGDSEIEQAVNAFFGEAFFNILDILATCHREMPNGVKGYSLSIDVAKTKKPALPSQSGDPICVKAAEKALA